MRTHYHSSIKKISIKLRYMPEEDFFREYYRKIHQRHSRRSYTRASNYRLCLELRAPTHTHIRAWRFFATGIVAHSSAPCVYKVYACETRHPARGLLPQVDNIGREKIISTRDSRLCFSANYTMKHRLAPVGCNLVTVRTKKERARARRIHVSKYQQQDLSTMHANRIFFFAIDVT